MAILALALPPGLARAASLQDPSVSWSTYFGGSGIETLRDVAVDAAGNVYAVGGTSSADLPTAFALDATLDGPSDAFVVKLDASGQSVLWATYLGGGGADAARAVGLDAAGNLIVAGETDSPDFPVVPAVGGIQPAPGGGTDGFLAVLAPDGSLLQATYLGGSARDSIGALAVAPSGRIALRGETESPDFPIASAIQPAPGGGIDAFVSLVEAGGGALVYATYLGGSGNDTPASTGYGVAIDAADGVLTCGTTESTDFPTAFAIQPQHAGGLRDGFLVKLAPGGASFAFATYWGRSRGDSIRACTLDAARNVYFGGTSRSHDLPLANAPQTLKRILYDAVLAKLDPTASQLLYATYWGGNQAEGVKDVAVDAAERLHALGETESSDFPLVDPMQDRHGGSLDAMLLKLTPGGGSFVLSSFLGGSSADAPYDVHAGIALDADGGMIVGGTTYSPDFPTRNALDATLAGVSDGWIARVAPGPEIELSLAGTPALATASARIVNRGNATAVVQVKLWTENGATQALATGLPELQTVAPGASLELLSNAPLPAGLSFPGARVGARLLDPSSGQIASEMQCSEVPCN